MQNDDNKLHEVCEHGMSTEFECHECYVQFLESELEACQDTLSVLIKRQDGSIVIDIKEIDDTTKDGKCVNWQFNETTNELVWTLEDHTCHDGE